MKNLTLLAVSFVLLSITNALDFYVGGKDGWVQNPKESYDHWAGRLRFQINDRLVFKYNKSENSVLVVNKQDYASCNMNNPVLKLEGGDSVFQFNRSGPFYFISGVADRCAKNQKLIVVVLAERKKKPSISPSPAPSIPSISPSPAPSIPSTSPPSPAPSIPSTSPPSPASSIPSISPPSPGSPSSDHGGGSPSSNQGGGSTTPTTGGPPPKSGASAINICKVGIAMVGLVLGHVILG